MKRSPPTPGLLTAGAAASTVSPVVSPRGTVFIRLYQSICLRTRRGLHVLTKEHAHEKGTPAHQDSRTRRSRCARIAPPRFRPRRPGARARGPQGVQLPQHRPDTAERPVRRLCRAPARAVDDLRRDRLRRPLEVGEQRHHVGVDLRHAGGHLDWRHCRGCHQPQHRLGRHGRSDHLAQHVLGRRRLQVHRRRQDLDEHGPQGDATISAASSSTRSTRTSSTWRPWATCIRKTPSAASSRPSTAARPGRSRST